MKEKLAQIASSDLTQKLIGQPYAFAAWRMPNQEKSHLAVALSHPRQVDADLHSLSPGFLFNKFSDNHPSHPFHIKADMVFTEDNIAIAPNISSDEIDDFLDRIEKPISQSKGLSQASISNANFEDIVAKAIGEIKNGIFEKVVLARHQDINLPENFSIADFFVSVCNQYPNSFCSMVHIQGQGIWIGASPETLLSADDETFKTISLAGTKALTEGQAISEIAWTQKEIEEQAFVSRYIVNCFKKIRLREFHEHGPKTVKAGNLSHLRTDFSVSLKDVQFDSLGSQMLELLHPTSAVCGMPLDAAKKFIAQNEGFDREFYSGFLGPININGSTDLFVNLRCMKIAGKSARFYAGAGITEDSNPTNELSETELKMSVLKSLV